MKDPINHANIMEFKDIPDGAHFKELGEKPRVFVKLKLTFAGGDPFKVHRITLGEDDKPQILMGHEINCVDYQGIGGKCPPFVQFEVIPTP